MSLSPKCDLAQMVALAHIAGTVSVRVGVVTRLTHLIQAYSVVWVYGTTPPCMVAGRDILTTRVPSERVQLGCHQRGLASQKSVVRSVSARP